MPTSQLALYNGALRNLGQRQLASLTEAREPRRWLDEIWDDDALKFVLEQGWWKFASRSVQLSHNPSFVWQFGYRWQFTKPTDYVRLGMFCSDQYFESTIDRYLAEHDFFYADVDPIWMQYVSNDAAYGANLNAWPEAFTQYVQAYLAELLGPRYKFTDQQMAKLEARTVKKKHDAQSKDAQEGPTIRQRMGSWNRARRGGGGLSIDRLRGGRLVG